MIDKFTTVYPGHIDLGDLGQAATPANERRYPSERLAGVFDKTEAVARKMDSMGWHTLWLAEHHFQHEGYECLPNLLMMAVHLAHVTKRLRIGCGFNITPMWRPLRLAEDYATADILTNRVRGGAWLPHPRARDLRLADAGSGGEPRALRGAGRDHLQGIQPRALQPPRQTLHAAARGALPGASARGPHPGPAAGQPAGGVLAAHRQREPARARLHGAPRHQGLGGRLRGNDAGGADPRLPGGPGG